MLSEQTPGGLIRRRGTAPDAMIPWRRAGGANQRAWGTRGLATRTPWPAGLLSRSPRITLPGVMPGWCAERPGAATSLVPALPSGSRYKRSVRTLREEAAMSALWWILFAVIWIAIAFWPARVAGRKGHSFIGYFIFSLFFFPAAIIVAYLVHDRTQVPAGATAAVS